MPSILLHRAKQLLTMLLVLLIFCENSRAEALCRLENTPVLSPTMFRNQAFGVRSLFVRPYVPKGRHALSFPRSSQGRKAKNEFFYTIGVAAVVGAVAALTAHGFSFGIPLVLIVANATIPRIPADPVGAWRPAKKFPEFVTEGARIRHVSEEAALTQEEDGVLGSEQMEDELDALGEGTVQSVNSPYIQIVIDRVGENRNVLFTFNLEEADLLVWVPGQVDPVEPVEIPVKYEVPKDREGLEEFASGWIKMKEGSMPARLALDIAGNLAVRKGIEVNTRNRLLIVLQRNFRFFSVDEQEEIIKHIRTGVEAGELPYEQTVMFVAKWRTLANPKTKKIDKFAEDWRRNTSTESRYQCLKETIHHLQETLNRNCITLGDVVKTLDISHQEIRHLIRIQLKMEPLDLGLFPDNIVDQPLVLILQRLRDAGYHPFIEDIEELLGRNPGALMAWAKTKRRRNPESYLNETYQLVPRPSGVQALLLPPVAEVRTFTFAKNIAQHWKVPLETVGTWLKVYAAFGMEGPALQHPFSEQGPTQATGAKGKNILPGDLDYRVSTSRMKVVAGEVSYDRRDRPLDPFLFSEHPDPDFPIQAINKAAVLLHRIVSHEDFGALLRGALNTQTWIPQGVDPAPHKLELQRFIETELETLIRWFYKDQPAYVVVESGRFLEYIDPKHHGSSHYGKERHVIYDAQEQFEEALRIEDESLRTLLIAQRLLHETYHIAMRRRGYAVIPYEAEVIASLLEKLLEVIERKKTSLPETSLLDRFIAWMVEKEETEILVKKASDLLEHYEQFHSVSSSNNMRSFLETFGSLGNIIFEPGLEIEDFLLNRFRKERERLSELMAEMDRSLRDQLIRLLRTHDNLASLRMEEEVSYFIQQPEQFLQFRHLLPRLQRAIADLENPKSPIAYANVETLLEELTVFEGLRREALLSDTASINPASNVLRNAKAQVRRRFNVEAVQEIQLDDRSARVIAWELPNESYRRQHAIKIEVLESTIHFSYYSYVHRQDSLITELPLPIVEMEATLNEQELPAAFRRFLTQVDAIDNPGSELVPRYATSPYEPLFFDPVESLLYIASSGLDQMHLGRIVSGTFAIQSLITANEIDPSYTTTDWIPSHWILHPNGRALYAIEPQGTLLRMNPSTYRILARSTFVVDPSSQLFFDSRGNLQVYDQSRQSIRTLDFWTLEDNGDSILVTMQPNFIRTTLGDLIGQEEMTNELIVVDGTSLQEKARGPAVSFFVGIPDGTIYAISPNSSEMVHYDSHLKVLKTYEIAAKQVLVTALGTVFAYDGERLFKIKDHGSTPLGTFTGLRLSAPADGHYFYGMSQNNLVVFNAMSGVEEARLERVMRFLPGINDEVFVLREGLQESLGLSQLVKYQIIPKTPIAKDSHRQGFIYLGGLVKLASLPVALALHLAYRTSTLPALLALATGSALLWILFHTAPFVVHGPIKGLRMLRSAA